MTPWTFLWVDDPSSLRAAPEGVPHVTILRPAGRARTAGWSEILGWYGAREGRAPGTAGYPRRPAPAPATHHWVVALGDGPSAVAAPLAAGLRRSFSRLRKPAAFGRWLQEHDPRSVLVAGETAAFDFETLTVLHRQALERDCRFGILTGADLAGLSFSAAKCLLADNRPAAGDLGIDAIFERQYRDGDNGEPFAGTILDTLRSAGHRAAVLLAHGEGSHLLLNEAVLCGLAGRADRFRGRPFRNGCTRERCKRAQGAGLGLLHVSDIRATFAAFLSCNSFSVAGQMYPSEVSLVLAAAESYPAFTLSNPWSVPYTPDDVPLLLSLLRRGVRLGEVVAFMNQTKARREQPDSYVLFGDPLAFLGAKATKLDGLPRVAAPGRESQLLCAPGADGPRVFEYCTGDRSVRRTFPSPRRTLVEVDGEASGPVVRIDRTAEVAAAEARLTDFGRRVEGLQDLENAVLAEAAHGRALEPALSQGIALQRRLRLDLEQIVTFGWRALATARASRLWDPLLDRIDGELHRRVGAWDLAFAALTRDHLLAGGVVGDRIFEALQFGYRETASRRGAPCQRCGVRTIEIELEHFRQGPPRRIVDCPLCGPLANHRVGGPALGLGLPARLRRGALVAVDAVMSPADATAPRDGFLVVEIRDKTKPQPFLRIASPQPLVDGIVRLELRLPADSGFDQHSMRAVWVGGLDVAFARRVFVLTPDPVAV